MPAQATKITPVEQGYLQRTLQQEQDCTHRMRSSQVFIDLERASASRQGFMFFLSQKYSLGPLDSVNINDGAIIRPAEKEEGNETKEEQSG